MRNDPHKTPVRVVRMFLFLASIVLALWLGVSGGIIWLARQAASGAEKTLWMEVAGLSGTLGDTFGVVNALFSGLALAGIVLALRLQAREIEETRQNQAKTEKLMLFATYLSALATIRETPPRSQLTPDQEVALDRIQAVAAEFEPQMREFFTSLPSREAVIATRLRELIKPLNDLTHPAEGKVERNFDAIEEVLNPAFQAFEKLAASMAADPFRASVNEVRSTFELLRRRRSPSSTNTARDAEFDRFLANCHVLIESVEKLASCYKCETDAHQKAQSSCNDEAS